MTMVAVYNFELGNGHMHFTTIGNCAARMTVLCFLAEDIMSDTRE